jgi:hypothetical protein
VQETLQADWQEAWHSPQPPLTQLSFKFAWFKVLICFMGFTDLSFEFTLL